MKLIGGRFGVWRREKRWWGCRGRGGRRCEWGREKVRSVGKGGGAASNLTISGVRIAILRWEYQPTIVSFCLSFRPMESFGPIIPLNFLLLSPHVLYVIFFWKIFLMGMYFPYAIYITYNKKVLLFVMVLSSIQNRNTFSFCIRSTKTCSCYVWRVHSLTQWKQAFVFCCAQYTMKMYFHQRGLANKFLQISFNQVVFWYFYFELNCLYF